MSFYIFPSCTQPIEIKYGISEAIEREGKRCKGDMVPVLLHFMDGYTVQWICTVCARRIP